MEEVNDIVHAQPGTAKRNKSARCRTLPSPGVLKDRTIHPMRLSLSGMRNAKVASLLVLAILAGAGAGYLAGNANERTITSTFTSTFSTTYVSNSVTTTTATEPAMTSFFYVTANGICTGPGGYVPCFGSPAYVFNSCPDLLAGPPAPYTCTYTVKDTLSPYPSYTINITIGVRGQATEPQWANCSMADASKMSYFVACIPVINSTAF